ncbi:spondin domain-containing protein [Fulvivirgaceae bacterium BMA12]|uniref:Spondin domain-containing protein n=1 Tax=Agaribacillus aureus TaxID=3051825 RepID=A0ABT8L7B8_9BACT|nr:spondin domain-containing protein [Fulvivirgaceae bacterium BMA12]
MRYLKILFVLVLLTLTFCGEDDQPKVEEDVDSPGVLQMTPADKAQNVPRDVVIEITFDEPVAHNSVESAFTLSNAGTTIVGNLLYQPLSSKLSFTPSRVLDFNTRYTVALTTDLTDTAGNAIEATHWSFTTVPETVNARYRVTFDATWSAQSHPADFPSNAHFSGLIGMTHAKDTSLFYINTPASLGIKDMAETGAKGNLTTEIQQIIDNGKGEFIISGGGVGSLPGRVSVEFDINISHPLVSITSMIAPSPDWFVAIHNLSLYKDGKWVGELTQVANSYDAGTDHGITFRASNQPTNPADNITALIDPPLGVNNVVAPLGTMTFLRIE